MRIERVVLDTNVLVSAALSPQGRPFRCLLWAVQRGAIVSSPQLLTELDRSLGRPRITRLARQPHFSAVRAAVWDSVDLVRPVQLKPTCRDPSDDVVLATALAGRADCIVSGDEDLLVLDPFEGIRILTPAAFLDAVGADTEPG